MESKTSAIILAGGRNTRMRGMDKAFLEIDGRPIIAGIVDKLRPLVNEVIVVTNSPCKYRDFNVKVVKDRMPRKGPLMGIYSGLKNSSSKYNFVVACDMPFLKKDLIRYLLDTKDGHDVIIPRIDKRFHPLFGIYSRRCIPIIEEMLRQDRLKISDIFPRLKTHFVVRREIEKFDKELLSLTNVNTKEEYEMLKRRRGICQTGNP